MRRGPAPSPIESGRVILLPSIRMILGTHSSDQVATKQNIVCVAIAGFIKGSIIWLKILNSPAPSILADSTISLENVALRYILMKNTVIGVAMAGTMSMIRLLIRWYL